MLEDGILGNSATRVVAPIMVIDVQLRIQDIATDCVGEFIQVIVRAVTPDGSIVEVIVPNGTVLGEDLEAVQIGSHVTFVIDGYGRPRVRVDNQRMA